MPLCDGSQELDVIEILLSLHPLVIFIKSVAFNTSENIIVNGWWCDSLVGHDDIRRLIRSNELLMPTDQIRAELILYDKFECLIFEREDWIGENRILPPINGIVCYTDG